MKKIKSILRLISDNSGATAIEYGLIAALIAVAIIVSLTAVGSNVSASFDKTASALAQS
jgi:pilus assembly protein Flp/PilA